MKTIITSTEEIVQNEKVIIWRIEKNDGAILININKLIDEGISECRWQDEKQKFLIVEYNDWDSNELIAIVTKEGRIIKKGIRSIEYFVDRYELFIITITGLALDFDAIEYNLENDEWNMAVIDKYGEFFIPPHYDSISYDEEDNIFYAEGSHGRIKHSITIEEGSPKLIN